MRYLTQPWASGDFRKNKTGGKTQKGGGDNKSSRIFWGKLVLSGITYNESVSLKGKQEALSRVAYLEVKIRKDHNT